MEEKRKQRNMRKTTIFAVIYYLYKNLKKFLKKGLKRALLLSLKMKFKPMRFLIYEKGKDIIKRTSKHLTWRESRSQTFISNLQSFGRTYAEKCLTKKQLAETMGKRPSDKTRWLSGEHNFTISTLSMLGTFFGEPIISVANLWKRKAFTIQDIKKGEKPVVGPESLYSILYYILIYPYHQNFLWK